MVRGKYIIVNLVPHMLDTWVTKHANRNAILNIFAQHTLSLPMIESGQLEKYLAVLTTSLVLCKRKLC